MRRKTLFTLSPLALATLLPLSSSAPRAPAVGSFGGPWISLEAPGNPYDDGPNAAFLVHVYHHGNPARYPVTGTAEGLVNGERRSVPLEFRETSRPGVYAVRRQWPTQGRWVLVATVKAVGEVTLFVQLGPEDSGERAAGDRDGASLRLERISVTQGGPRAARIESALRAGE
jgi:hypothetical protein